MSWGSSLPRGSVQTWGSVAYSLDMVKFDVELVTTEMTPSVARSTSRGIAMLSEKGNNTKVKTGSGSGRPNHVQTGEK